MTDRRPSSLSVVASDDRRVDRRRANGAPSRSGPGARPAAPEATTTAKIRPTSSVPLEGMSPAEAREAFATAYLISAARCRHRPFPNGESITGARAALRTEARAFADRILANVDPDALPDADVLVDATLLGEAHRQLVRGDRDVARRLAATVADRLAVTS